MFDHVQELAEDPGCFVFILIDEVESIASARQASQTAQEPGDAVRVVNAVLTSLDSLKRRPNVLVLCTSNMLGSIDPAFCDRLDLQLYMGPPPTSARFEILRSCLLELMSKRVLQDRQRALFEDTATATVVATTTSSSVVASQRDRSESASSNPVGLLWRVADATEGMSGRLLRRLPLKAFSHCFARGPISAVQLGVKFELPTTTTAATSATATVRPGVVAESPPLSLTVFLLALEQVALDEKHLIVADKSTGSSVITPVSLPSLNDERLQQAAHEQDPYHSQSESKGQFEYTPSDGNSEETSHRSGHSQSQEKASLTGGAGGVEAGDEDEITVDGDDNEDAIAASWNMIVN